MLQHTIRRPILAGLVAGGVLGPATTALAQPTVTFSQAFDVAQAQAPANLVLEVELTASGNVWEADTLFPNGTSHLEVEISAASGTVIEAETETAEPDMAAIAAAFAGAAVTWAEAIAIAGDAFPAGWVRHMELEFEESAGGQLVFEATVVDAGTPVTIDISAATGRILGDDPNGPCAGPVDLLGAAAAVEAAFPGRPVIEVEPTTEDGFAAFEVEFADAAAQTVSDVDVRAVDGCFDEPDLVTDEPWAEVAQILALLPDATVDRAAALATAEDAAGGTAIGWELEVEGGQLLHEVDVLTPAGVVEVHVDAITGGAGGGGEPGGDVVLVGALDAWAIGRDATPGGFPLEVELEVVPGGLEWEAELLDGATLVEHDIDPVTGAVLDTDLESAGAEAAAVQSAFAAATVPTTAAVATALAQVPGGFVHEIERERSGDQPRYEIGLVSESQRFEVEIDAVAGGVLEVELVGPAHLAPASEGPGMAGLATLTPGDLDDDDLVTLTDLIAVIGAFGSADASGDADLDGDVDLDDLLLVLSLFGTAYEG